MTDRIHSLTVALSNDIREDDIKSLINAIAMLRGVAGVTTHVADPISYMAEERAKRDLGQKVIEAIYPQAKKGQPI